MSRHSFIIRNETIYITTLHSLNNNLSDLCSQASFGAECHELGLVFGFSEETVFFHEGAPGLQVRRLSLRVEGSGPV